MPVTKEFVEQYVALLVESGPAKTKTVSELIRIVAKGEQIPVDDMFEDSEIKKTGSS